jgi:general secretion pathway protein G
MTPEHAPTHMQQEETARPSYVGRVAIIVVVLVATAGAFGIARLTFDPTLSRAQRQTRAEIRSLEGHFKSYHRVIGSFPTQAENFQALIQVGLIQEPPKDPWGRPYLYRMERGKGYVLSYGEDGLPGGTGEAADIISGGVLDSSVLGEGQLEAQGDRP